MEIGYVIGLVVSVLLVTVCLGGLVRPSLLWRNRPRR